MKSNDRVAAHERCRATIRRAACSLLFALAVPAIAQQAFDAPPVAYPPPQTANVAMPPASSGYPNADNANVIGTQDMTTRSASNAWPSQDTSPPDARGSYGNPPPAGAATPSVGAMRALLQAETQDFGVAPQEQLQTVLHSPTPTRIPGGQLITTDRLLDLYRQAGQNGLLVFHVLGQGPTLPNAQNAGPASQPGSFDDSTQQEFGQYLQQVSQGNKARPMVFYCLNTHCWMSYNASLRAIHMGYTQVYWYRGGIEAWQQAQQLSAGANGGQPAPYAEQRPAAAYR